MVEHTAEKISVAKRPSGNPIQITKHQYRGAVDGPRVYIQAAQHGREINGTEVLREFHTRILNTSLAGEVVTVPVADPLTFDYARYTTQEEVDQIHPNINRTWPGNTEGTLHEKMASKLWQLIHPSDVVIDLHSATGDILSHVVHTSGDIESERLAAAFGTDLLLAEPAHDNARQEWHDRNFDGKLRVVACDHGIPCITPELGNSRRIDEKAIQTGVTGICNVLKEVDALSGEPQPNGEGQRKRNHLGRIPAAKSGLFRPESDWELGEVVSPGDILGHVYAPESFALLQTVEATNEGVLYSLTREGMVTAGDQLVSLGVDRNHTE